MIKYRGRHLIRAGFVGVTLILLIVMVGLQPERLTSWATTVRYHALFEEAGGLVDGADVTLSGMKIGQVTAVTLNDDTGQVEVSFTIPGQVQLRSDATAHIRTGTLLGQRVLQLENAGTGQLKPNSVIPITRTSSPYTLNDAVGDLTKSAAGTDTQALNQSLDTLAATIDQIAPQLGPTFDGLTRVSRSINERDDTLRELLKGTADLTGVLADRSQRVNALILNSDDLLEVLVARRQAIMSLLANTSVVATQLSGLVADNEKDLAPSLQKLNTVTAMLERNRDSLGKALPGLAKYAITQGETVSNGFYYSSFVANLEPAQLIQPFLDYALGFRRGTDAGQPPDNAGPRAELPFPRNAIPQPNERWGPP